MMISHNADLRAVEATLFAAENPLSVEQIRRYVGEEVDIRAALNALAEQYAGRGIELVERGERWHFQTASDLAHLLRRERQELRKLSRAAVESLAIIAYHEPVSRAEIESIRGVQISKGTLDVLMEAGWVRGAGRREAPGRPLTYATTAEFLSHFGLQSRKDLPGIADLKAAGLLDPVDLAFDEMQESAQGDGASDGTAEGPAEGAIDRPNNYANNGAVVPDIALNLPKNANQVEINHDEA